MADPIAALMGLEMDDETKLRAMADRLRRQRRAAEAFTMSGTPQIAKGSVDEMASIDAAAKAAGGYRQQGLQRALTQKMQEDRLAEQDRRDLRQRGWNQADDLRDFERENEERIRLKQEAEAALDAQQMQQGFELYVDPKNPDRKMQVRIVGGDILNSQGVPVDIGGMMKWDDYQDTLDAKASTSASPYKEVGGDKWGSVSERMETAIAGTKAEDMQGFVNGYDDWKAFAPGVGLAQDIDLHAVRSGWWGDETEKARAEWWANYQKYIENPERNAMFGATLTDNELKTWNASSINPSMDPRYVRHRLEIQQEVAQAAAEKAALVALEKGASMTSIRLQFPTLDIDDLVAQVADGSYFENRPKRFASLEQRIKEIDMAEEQGIDYDPNFTPIDLKRLEELRAKRERGEID
jgi:hypothetical protein